MLQVLQITALLALIIFPAALVAVLYLLWRDVRRLADHFAPEMVYGELDYEEEPEVVGDEEEELEEGELEDEEEGFEEGEEQDWVEGEQDVPDRIR